MSVLNGEYDLTEKRTQFLNAKNIHPSEKIKYLNKELSMLKLVASTLAGSGDAILQNRLQMLEFYYTLDVRMEPHGIRGHFWVENRDGETIDYQFKDFTDLIAKAWLGTDKYKPVYRKCSREIQEQMINKWINPRIKKYRNVLSKYRQYFKEGENWVETLDRLTEPEEGRCHMNAMLNYLTNENSMIYYGDYGVSSVAGLDTRWEYEHDYEPSDEEVIPPYLLKLSKSDVVKLLLILND